MNTWVLVIAILGGLAAATMVLVVAFPAPPRLPLHRRRPVSSVQENGPFDHIIRFVSSILLRKKKTFPLLELAGLKTSPATIIVRTGLATLITATAGFLFSIELGLFTIIAVPGTVYLWIKNEAAKRRRAFATQLDDTLQLIAGAMRAGHSVSSALLFVAEETDDPTSSELMRVVNEVRLGRDLGESLIEVSLRMENEDFAWIAQAIQINRELGGNLTEVLDGVSNTVRERASLMRQVDALASEGKLSGIILMALPFVVGLAVAVINPGYITPLVTRPIGWLLLALAAGLLISGGLWMKSVVRIKF